MGKKFASFSYSSLSQSDFQHLITNDGILKPKSEGIHASSYAEYRNVTTLFQHLALRRVTVLIHHGQMTIGISSEKYSPKR